MEANEIGKRLLVDVRSKLKAEWTHLSDLARADISAAVADISALALAGVAGADVGQALLEAEATIANWAWAASSVARRVVLDVLATAFRLAGEFLAGLAERLLTG